jgi:hypothetical protein
LTEIYDKKLAQNLQKNYLDMDIFFGDCRGIFPTFFRRRTNFCPRDPLPATRPRHFSKKRFFNHPSIFLPCMVRARVASHFAFFQKPLLEESIEVCRFGHFYVPKKCPFAKK